MQWGVVGTNKKVGVKSYLVLPNRKVEKQGQHKSNEYNSLLLTEHFSTESKQDSLEE